ncbi:phosphate-starvation-inducible PsiE family protein [Nitrosophilus labii]|uniref:phosphate-starvation-inducible PsiE family protein n=1 Tax=Nitrosophilus labii TaxID=2706014 RepID=UPI001656C8ED|nr:phosphate-starvation-inducible PsiE family protein [Nitrosophilus labii]
MKKLKDYFEVLVASFIFAAILITKSDFYNTVIVLLEFIVIIEVIQMIFIFFKKQRVKIRYMVDTSIIYSIRELLIAFIHQNIDHIRVTVLLSIIFALFLLRYLSIKITYTVTSQNQP